MVTMLPSFISDLMTSAAFTDILCARSATVTVSGMCTSRTTGSIGALNWCAASRAGTAPPPSRDLFFLCLLYRFRRSLGDLGFVQGGIGRRRSDLFRRHRRFPRFFLFALFRQPALAFLFLRKLRSLARRELFLAPPLLLAQLGFVRIDRGARNGLRFGNRRRRTGIRSIALDEHALLLDLHLDGARFAAHVRFLDDLRGLLARERDLGLGLDGAVRPAQVLEQLRLVLVGEEVV